MKIKQLKIVALIMLAIVAFDGCSKLNPSPKTEGQSFSSPREATDTLIAAVEQSDINALHKIMGPEGQYLIDTGDSVLDSIRRKKFLKLTGEKLIFAGDQDRVVMNIGKREWPFPIPLVRQDNKWTFDVEDGKEEILNRRIGENEITAINLARAFVDAEELYYNTDPDEDKTHNFAAKILSTPGKKDGLYWEGGKKPSPFGPLVSESEAEGYDPNNMRGRPYHGYYFRVLTGQGENASDGPVDYFGPNGKMTEGFALIAFPAVWGESGVMTFEVNYEGKIFQKSLGADTFSVASKILEFNPDSSWEEVKK